MMRRLTLVVPCAMAALGALAPLAPDSGLPFRPRPQAQEHEQESLYERLGGVYALGSVVDAFVDRLLVDDTLNANPAILAARDRVPAPGLKFQVTTLMCQVTGGPYAYVGRSMKAAHAHLNIGAEEWQALEADLVATLDAFAVPAAEQEELLALVGSTRPDIVSERPAEAQADPRAIWPPEDDTSLYGRLGGVYAIASVVDAFIDRVLADDTLNANPAIRAARDRVPAAGLKVQVTALVCQVTGGPYAYHGRTMKAAHAHLDIGEEEWRALVADLVATLDAFGVPAAEQEELLATVGSTHDDIVTRRD